MSYKPEIARAKGSESATSIVVFGVPLAGVLYLLRAKFPDAAWMWPTEMDVPIMGILASVVAYWTARVRNWQKHKNDPAIVNVNGLGGFKPGIVLALIGAGLLCGGCTTSAVNTVFSETITDTDGVITSTEYSARSKAGLMGELDTSSHDFRYSYGGEENIISAGQSSAGIDNSNQTLLMPILEALINAIATRAQTPAPEPVDVGPPVISTIPWPPQ